LTGLGVRRLITVQEAAWNYFETTASDAVQTVDFGMTATKEFR